MRRKLIAGNWKMNTDRASAVSLARNIAERAGEFGRLDLLVCPPAVYLLPVLEVISKSPVALARKTCITRPMARLPARSALRC